MTINLDKLVEKTGGRSFGVNEWGSCQYTTALNMFDTLEKFYLRSKSSTPEEGREKAFKKVEAKVTHDGVVDIKEAWKVFKKEMIENIKGMDDKEWLTKVKKELKDATPSVDAMFEITKNQSWDLWSAAPFIVGLMFKNLQVNELKAPGVGPVLNVEFQGLNYNVGVACWLLWSHKLVKDQKAFSGFDT